MNLIVSIYTSNLYNVYYTHIFINYVDVFFAILGFFRTTGCIYSLSADIIFCTAFYASTARIPWTNYRTLVLHMLRYKYTHVNNYLHLLLKYNYKYPKYERYGKYVKDVYTFIWYSLV